MAQRVYKPATIFNARVVGMRNLWEPSREYMGKPTEKPNYLVSVIIPKTRPDWTQEPLLADFTRAASELYSAALSHIPFQQIIWPLKDGDVPDPGRTVTEWRKGNWLLTGSSTSPISVSVIQNGQPVPLLNRMKVKNGDYVGVGVSMAVKANDPRGVKVYCNSVLFMAEGEEIVVGNSVSASDLMAQATAQGMNVTGFGGGAPGAPAPGGFGAPGGPAPGGFGFGPAATNGTAPGFAPPPMQPPATAPAGFGNGFTAPTGFPQRQ